MRRWIVILLFGLCLSGVATSLYLFREKTLRGDDFKLIVVRSDANSYASWSLYYEDAYVYCMRLSRPIIPERFCVPKTDIEVRNADNGRSRFGAIYKGELVLKKDRYHGAAEELF